MSDGRVTAHRSALSGARVRPRSPVVHAPAVPSAARRPHQAQPRARLPGDEGFARRHRRRAAGRGVPATRRPRADDAVPGRAGARAEQNAERCGRTGVCRDRGTGGEAGGSSGHAHEHTRSRPPTSARSPGPEWPLPAPRACPRRGGRGRTPRAQLRALRSPDARRAPRRRLAPARPDRPRPRGPRSAEPIGAPVHAPPLVRTGGQRTRSAGAHDAAAPLRRPAPEREPLLSVQAADALHVHRPALAPEEHGQPRVPELTRVSASSRSRVRRGVWEGRRLR